MRYQALQRLSYAYKFTTERLFKVSKVYLNLWYFTNNMFLSYVIFFELFKSIPSCSLIQPIKWNETFRFTSKPGAKKNYKYDFTLQLRNEFSLSIVWWKGKRLNLSPQNTTVNLAFVFGKQETLFCTKRNSGLVLICNPKHLLIRVAL